MFVTLSEDIAAFVKELGGEVIFTRVTVTPAQVAQYDLPTAPPKPGDNRAFHGSTCQAEALAPDAMNRILQKAIEQRTDRKKLERVLRRERQARRELAAKLGAA